VEARLTLRSQESYLEQKEKTMNTRIWSLKRDLAEAKEFHLRLLGDVSLRKVIEEIENKRSAQKWEKAYRSENERYSLNREGLWNTILNEETSCIEFQKLQSLRNEGVAVAGIISDIFIIASGDEYCSKFEKVFIDSSKLNSTQVMVAKALCDDFPIEYIYGREDEFIDIMSFMSISLEDMTDVDGST